MESLEQWLQREYRYAAAAMLRSVSPVGLVQTRPGFGRTVHAARGSIVASPVLGAYDPDPDYFFHWFRDAAVVMDALRLLHEDGAPGAEALVHHADHLRFNHALEALDGRALVRNSAWRAAVAPGFRRFLREDADLSGVHGDAVVADTRVNPDGTLDISTWARPQHDGPALRALSLLRWLPHADGPAARALLRADLDFCRRRWREPSYDIWEEDLGRHYYTLRVTAAALAEGARWLERENDTAAALACGGQSRIILQELDGFWLEREGHYGSRLPGSGERPAKALDISVILATIHAGAAQGPHSVHDPRMQATLARLEAAFDAHFPANRGRTAGRGPALGRYVGDVYYGGGAWYLSTLGAAEFCFRAAAAEPDARAWRARGEAYLATVRACTPEGGELSEQFDPQTGAQKSARHLAWSYAAFISCLAARRALG
jgi:glucoamylase